MSEKRKWYGGPPPHVGWWNASSDEHNFVWRWWNGRRWSIGVAPSQERPEVFAGMPASSRKIKWTDYWPEDARVPRIAP